MPETDTPLKDLVREFAPDFAAWLLNVDLAEIREMHPENIELPAGAVRSDTVFHVTLADGRRTLLHIEFQGERSERPMRWRMLDYMSRLAAQEWDFLCSAVLYVGDGAGAHDTGNHVVYCADGSVALAWRYRVIRLWEMSAEELLALGRPALLALIGQTRIEEPTQVVPRAIATIAQVEDMGQRVRLLTALTSLMRDKEVLEMTERLMEAMDQGLMMDTPFLRRIREKSWIEGAAEGRVALRQGVLDTVATRFDPPITHYQRIAARLENIGDFGRLRDLLQAALRANDLAGVEQALGV